MIGRSWRRHGIRLFAALALLMLAGWLMGHTGVVLLVGLSGYLVWQLFNIGRLDQWLSDEQRSPPESLGIWADIFDQIHTLEKLNQRQLEQNRKIIGEFRSMTDALPDATLVLDEQDAITWFNEAARKLLALKNPEDLGQPVTNLLRDPDLADWISAASQLESRFEMSSPLDVNVRLSVSALRHREDQRLLILRDVTDLHNLEQVRRDFVANVSHELRTPLTVLTGYLESLRGYDDVELAPAIERMQDQAMQMQALLTDLLELSRLQESTQSPLDEPMDVCAMLLQLREQAEEISRGRHSIQIDCERGLQLLGNRKDIESAFRNLLSNAVKYTPAPGNIHITWRREPDALVLRVSDTGMGIPSRSIPRLTERFYRVGSDRARQRGGTGLGLAIVKHALNSHGARLEVESTLGEGSTFSCIFPLTREVSIKPERSDTR